MTITSSDDPRKVKISKWEEGGLQLRRRKYSEDMLPSLRPFTNITLCSHPLAQLEPVLSQSKYSQTSVRHILTSNHISSESRLDIGNKRSLSHGVRDIQFCSNLLISRSSGLPCRCAPQGTYHAENATLKGIRRPPPYYGASPLSRRSIDHPNNMFLKRGFSSFRGRLDTFRSFGSSSEMENPSTAKNHRVFIALGSNVGDRIEMIEKACLEMESCGIRVKRTSSLFETEPMYVLDQEPFINGVCEVRFHSPFLFVGTRIDLFPIVIALTICYRPKLRWALLNF